ncbi:MAG: FHA domain-containing protein, partial [Ktedonobacteraceae bacterium]
GRNIKSDIYLEDTYVSRSHATIVYLGNGTYALRDEDSANGTVLNGKRLKSYQLYVLKNGDRIQISETNFVFMKR